MNNNVMIGAVKRQLFWVVGKYPNYRVTQNRPKGKLVREPFDSEIAARKWIALQFLIEA